MKVCVCFQFSSQPACSLRVPFKPNQTPKIWCFCHLLSHKKDAFVSKHLVQRDSQALVAENIHKTAHTHTHTLSLSLTHTHTHIYTHTHTERVNWNWAIYLCSHRRCLSGCYTRRVCSEKRGHHSPRLGGNQGRTTHRTGRCSPRDRCTVQPRVPQGPRWSPAVLCPAWCRQWNQHLFNCKKEVLVNASHAQPKVCDSYEKQN